MSKTALSGLRAIKRDFSSSTLNSSSQPTDDSEIFWPSSPPAVTKILSAKEKRLKAITAALAGKPAENTTRPLASASSQILSKRPFPSSIIDNKTDEPPTKKRLLPSNWDLPSEAPSKQAIASSTSSKVKAVTNISTTAKPTSKPAPVFLSQEQTQILKLVGEGNSVFYTGSAGTGKSVLLREVIKTLKKKHMKSADAVAITASTGIAACNIGGVTIHSFAGIGLGIESAEDLASKIRKNKKATARWLRTKVLIIDEVSMVDGDLFDKLARIGSILRKKIDPFGGIQVIVTGDFFQLPPVTKGSSQVKFAFEAQLWNETIKRTFNLTKVFRQRDEEFIDMLNEMRFGRLTNKSIAKFKSLSRPITYEDGINATELFPRREDVDRANLTRSGQLRTEQRKYYATDSGSIQDTQQREKLLSNFMAPAVLDLRIDAQVMLIKNVDETLVNGSMGTIIRFMDPAMVGINDEDLAAAGIKKDMKKSTTARETILYPLVRFAIPGGHYKDVIVMPESWKVELPSGEIQVQRSQLPLILAWAMSIHKSQGQTLERVKVDLGKVFEKGQAYVALSRAVSLEGLQVLNFHPDKVNAHPKVAQWSRTLETIDLQ